MRPSSGIRRCGRRGSSSRRSATSYPDDVAEEMKEKFAEAFDELEEASAV